MKQNRRHIIFYITFGLLRGLSGPANIHNVKYSSYDSNGGDANIKFEYGNFFLIYFN